MSSAPPPHPGSAWQQCHDQGSGYPYYWNTTTNQVRWDCPPEFRQWQISLAKPPPATLPPPKLVTDVKLATVVQAEVRQNSSSPPVASLIPPVSMPSTASALVSGYDSDSEEDEEDNENNEEKNSEVIPEAATVEAQPDFIGPIIPKPSKSEPEQENDTNDGEPVEPPPPGSDSEENEALLLRKLKEKSETLAQMGGDIDSSVKEIIDPENIAKIESDLADDILSQIEAEKPPDYLGQQPILPVAPAQPSLPLQPVKPPLPLPRRPLQPSSMLQLACNYGHESDSDTEDAEPPARKTVTSKLLPVTGQLDSLGRIVFNQGGSSGSGWQTEEQREALESYKAQSASEDQTNGQDESRPRDKYEAVNHGSRKRRLALPGGRFNKTDQSEMEVQSKNNTKTEFKPMNFVKSASIIPGTIDEPEKGDVEKKENIEILSHANDDLVQPDVSTQAAELVEKLEYFKVGEEKVSSLKTLAIKLETLYSAWSAGALSLPYLNIVLQTAKKKIEEAENSLDTPPWKAIWDRLVPFHF